MKIKIALAFGAACLMLSSVSRAADRIKNGGALWACTTPGGLVDKGILVDLFEATEEIGYIIAPVTANDPLQIAQEKANLLRMQHPAYAGAWSAALQEVQAKMRVVNGELETVPDSFFRLRPAAESCPMGKWTYTQFADFTGLDQVLIQKSLWESPRISSLDKGALLWHEALYRWMRVQYGDQDSVRARQLVALLFAQMPLAEREQKIQAVLRNNPSNPNPPVPPQPQPQDDWTCMIRNQHNSLVYVGKGAVESIARAAAQNSCQMGQDPFFCDKHGLTCEHAVDSKIHWACQVENRHEGKIFQGAGRTKVEAQFESLNACTKGSAAFFCDRDPACEEVP